MMTGFIIRKSLSYASTRDTSSRDAVQMSGYRERAVDPAIRVYGILVCRRKERWDVIDAAGPSAAMYTKFRDKALQRPSDQTPLVLYSCPRACLDIHYYNLIFRLIYAVSHHIVLQSRYKPDEND